MKIELKVKLENGKEITFDDSEARELYQKLEKIYGAKKTEYVYYPVYQQPQPIVINPWPYQPWTWPITICSTSSNTSYTWKTDSGIVYEITSTI